MIVIQVLWEANMLAFFPVLIPAGQAHLATRIELCALWTEEMQALR
jgi:hypothetical protein